MMSENNNVIMFFDLCRLCLAKQGSIDIFDQAGLQSDITVCTGLQLTLSDNLPRKVCSICWDIIKKAMELRLVATKNNFHLKSLFEDENEQTELSLCQVMIENLIQLETDNCAEFNTKDSVDSSISNSNQERCVITIRKDLFEQPQTEPVCRTKETKRAKKRQKKKKKSHEEDKRQHKTPDTSTEYDTKETKRAKKRRKEKKKSHEEDKRQHKTSDTSTECDTKETKRAKKRHKENEIQHKTPDKGTECDTIETESTETNKENRTIKSSQSDDAITFACEQCSKTFNTFKKLYLHRRFHNKTMGCPFGSCGKLFACKGDLDKHIRTHTGEKPYECEICKKTFAQKVTLKGHMTAVHCKPGV